ncbi:dipeptide ABC transporter ATP-binding protein [Tessaracoccus palaemonis]|uniref:ABC transporter ATP-binding protein n=1 Tax=Tessaracoccus palaemonis TaxID=2829499 RepID=A0ABX8SII7_9ACTN|nr:ABC transporter ATP-binding protein [Tessaracoccus palaemonis]QXT63201.1 ABC transporter ATP-binding protein [Tessaracoccus palaemonis]
MSSVLSVDDLVIDYETREGRSRAVDGVSFDLRRGEMLGIVGESGSGKTTIAQTIIGLQADNARIAGGSVRLGDLDLLNASRREWRQVRGSRIGLIPQDPGNSLNPLRRIGASIAEPLLLHGVGRAEADRRVLELLDLVGIPEPKRRARQYPHELSGGMRQRVLIAAAVALEPEVIIADEPTSALDVTVQRRILDLIDELRARIEASVLFITHDVGVAGERADRLLVMRSGALEEIGPTPRVLASPRQEYTKRLIADAPSFSARTRERVDVTGAPLVTVTGLVREFGDFRAVDKVSFTVARGTTHALVGESGSGKTTTGRIVAGLDRPTSGHVQIGGDEVLVGRGAAARRQRRTVQLVYQNPFGSLDPRRTVGETIAEPLLNFRSTLRQAQGTGGAQGARERSRRVAELLDAVALPRDYATRLPRELSGGQRQRVAIARALVLDPQVVVLDEAVSALDVTVQAQILELLAELQRERGLTYLFISHDLAVVRQISDTVSVLRAGVQVESGPTETVFHRPEHEYTLALLDAIPGRHFATI